MQNQNPSTSTYQNISAMMPTISPSPFQFNPALRFLQQPSANSLLNMARPVESVNREDLGQVNAARHWHTQNWMQNHIYNSLYSPSPSTAPSILSNVSSQSAPDDASSISVSSNFNWNCQFPSASVASPGPSSSENVDPKTRQTINEYVDSFISSLADNDADVRAKCIDTMRQFAAKKLFSYAKEEKIKAMMRLLIDLLIAKKTIAEPSPYYRHSITIIHHLLTVGGSISQCCKEAARSGLFFQHLLDFLRNENGGSKHIAINSIKALMQGNIVGKTTVMEKGGMDILLRFLDVCKHNFKERRAALLSLLSMLGQHKKFAQKFVQLNGIQILTKSIFDDFSPEMVYDSMKCLCMVSDLEEICTLSLDSTLELAIKVIVSSSSQSTQEGDRQLQTVKHAISFLSNVLVVNSSAKKSLTMMREPRALEFIVSIAWQCAKISNTNLKKFIANDILDRCLVAIHAVNREDNEERAQASKLMSTNSMAIQLFQTVLLLPNTVYQNRVISIWFKMLSNGIMPDDLNVSKMIMKFVVERIEAANLQQSSSDASEQSFKRATYSRAIINTAIHCLQGLLENPQHSEIIVVQIKEGYFNPLLLLSNLKIVEVCATLLDFLEMLCSKEFNLRAKWAQDTSATQMFQICSQSSDAKIAKVGAKLMKMIEFETEEYVSPLYDAFSSTMEF